MSSFLAQKIGLPAAYAAAYAGRGYPGYASFGLPYPAGRSHLPFRCFSFLLPCQKRKAKKMTKEDVGPGDGVARFFFFAQRRRNAESESRSPSVGSVRDPAPFFFTLSAPPPPFAPPPSVAVGGKVLSSCTPIKWIKMKELT